MDGLKETEDFIFGRGKFSHLGTGVITYNGKNKKLLNICLELEKQGKLKRGKEDEDSTVWMLTDRI